MDASCYLSILAYRAGSHLLLGPRGRWEPTLSAFISLIHSIFSKSNAFIILTVITVFPVVAEGCPDFVSNKIRF